MKIRFHSRSKRVLEEDANVSPVIKKCILSERKDETNLLDGIKQVGSPITFWRKLSRLQDNRYGTFGKNTERKNKRQTNITNNSENKEQRRKLTKNHPEQLKLVVRAEYIRNTILATWKLFFFHSYKDSSEIQKQFRYVRNCNPRNRKLLKSKRVRAMDGNQKRRVWNTSVLFTETKKVTSKFWAKTNSQWRRKEIFCWRWS